MLVALLSLAGIVALAIAAIWWAITPPTQSFDSQGRHRLGLDQENERRAVVAAGALTNRRNP